MQTSSIPQVSAECPLCAVLNKTNKHLHPKEVFILLRQAVNKKKVHSTVQKTTLSMWPGGVDLK